MPNNLCIIMPEADAGLFGFELLSETVTGHIAIALEGEGDIMCRADLSAPGAAPLPGDITSLPALAAYIESLEYTHALVFLAPAPAVTREDIGALKNAVHPARLTYSGDTIAVCGRAAAVAAALRSGGDYDGLEVIQTMYPSATGCESLHSLQEVIRHKINSQHMHDGVYLHDPRTTFISPRARIAPGCSILPGCQIFGKSRIGANSVIGPNCYLENAVLGEDVRVNASQIYDSTVGSKTTVGPFSYIRPGCEIGENVRIGDFVELKKSVIGRGTKVAHLTYIGDSEFGEDINVGCGVVTVNYDGKTKPKTVVESGSFIGCNVNLVAPVRVRRGAYVAAGSTITDDVEEDSLAIARAKQQVKPGWARRRRESGKL